MRFQAFFNSNSPARSHRWVLLGVVCLAFVLRAYRLDAQELRGDEAFSISFSSRPIVGIVTTILRNLEPHPPGSYVLWHGWLKLAGRSEFAARFPSVIFGTLTVVLVYTLGQRLLGRLSAHMAAVLAAVNPYLIWHSQEVRMYALAALLGLASSYTLLRAISVSKGLGYFRITWESPGKCRWWVGYGLITAVGLYAHYYLIFIVAAQAMSVFVLAWIERRGWSGRSIWQMLRPWLMAQAVLALLYLPWIVAARRVLSAYHGNADSPSLIEASGRCLRAFVLGETVNWQTATPFLIVFGLVAAVGVLNTARQHPWTALFLSTYLLLPVLAVWAAAIRRPIFDERYLIAAAPPFYLLIAAGLMLPERPRPSIPQQGEVKELYFRMENSPASCSLRRLQLAGQTLALLVILVGTGISLNNYYFNPAYSKTRGWRELAHTLEQLGQPGDVIIQNYPDPTLWYYYRGSLPHLVLPASAPLDPDATSAELQRLSRVYQRLWLIPQPTPGWDPDGFVETWLTRHAERHVDRQIGVFHLRGYVPPPFFLAEMTPVHARFGAGVELLGFRLESSISRGSPLLLTLYWRCRSTLEVSYTVFIHLVGPDGQIHGQQDNPPVNGTYPTTEWQPGEIIVDQYVITVTGEAPPGQYRLLTGLYISPNGPRLSVSTPEGQFLADHIVLPVNITIK